MPASRQNLTATALTPQEQAIVSLKYKSKKIGLMTDQELDLWPPTLLLKIHVITGWQIPAGALYTVLEDQFRKVLLEEYSELNVDEIEHAFRVGAGTVEDWGKNFNLGLVSKILKPYLKERYYISDMEQQINRVDDGYTEAASASWWRGEINSTYQQFLAGSEPRIYWYMYEVLVEDKFIHPKFYKEELGNIQASAECSTDEENSRLAKSRAVRYLFGEAKKLNLKNLYKL